MWCVILIDDDSETLSGQPLVWCPILFDDFSATRSHQPLGALRREKWYRDVPFTDLKDGMARPFQATQRPEGSALGVQRG